ncbi:iron-containing alcohol dehydrogenase [Flavobacterium sp. UBA6031]|uniref:iron-containing alcohol dehydrogenase n=1 Tax=Flavobacterium sp. UBA6031 TaxID=1946551 RepID=UPI0025C54E4E|nr:iron-containing alcohol dehydrogenase [Flavobacterium sp. UBA6031]
MTIGTPNVVLALVHGMAHPLEVYFDIHHGVANVLLFHIVIKYNATSYIEKYGDITITIFDNFWIK